MKAMKPETVPKTIDEYLAPLSKEKRAALEKLRRDIRAAAPRAEECISYQIPAFRLDGRMLVAFGAAAKHCAFYPGAWPVKALKKELESYSTSKGTLRFPAESPLPATLVRKLVKARIAEYSAARPVAAGRARRRRQVAAGSGEYDLLRGTVGGRAVTRRPVAKNGRRRKPGTGGEAGSEEVEAFLASLDYRFKKGLLALRQTILGADPSIGEGIKWKAPSFRTSEYFATFHLRAKDGVQVILHQGAKKRNGPALRGKIADPDALLEWLGGDRALAKFRSPEDIEAKRSAFTKIIRQWIEHV